MEVIGDREKDFERYIGDKIAKNSGLEFER